MNPSGNALTNACCCYTGETLGDCLRRGKEKIEKLLAEVLRCGPKSLRREVVP